VILDAVGGAQFEKLVASAAERARIYAYGVLGGGESGGYPSFPIVMKMLSIKGYNVGDLLMDPIKSQEGIRFVQERLEANGHIGKVVLSV
jgi:NADPH:quinone reductase-like Zn-dependent oxidoreductase